MEVTISEIDKYIESLKQIALEISKKGSYRYSNGLKIEINIDKMKEDVKVNISIFDL